MSNKTLFFLGAGATKDIAEDAPLNKDLVRKALGEFSDTDQAKQIKKLINILYHRRKNPPVDNQIWNLLDYMIQQGRIGINSYDLERIEGIRENLLGLIIQLIDKKLRSTEVETYRKFIQAIINTQSCVISTNYDIVIDNALAMASSMNYMSKFRSHVTIEPIYDYFTHGLHRARKDIATQINSGPIELLKLHGSLNWLYCRKCDEVDLTVFQKGGVDALSGLYCCNENCTNKYEPLLMTPTMFKNYDNRFIKEIWRSAEERLIYADNLVFVGYSLKEEDYQIRCLLMKALLCRKDSYRKVLVIEREADGEDLKNLRKEVCTKYKELYGENVNFQAIGFTKFVNSIQKYGLGDAVASGGAEGERKEETASEKVSTNKKPWIDPEKTRDWLRNIPNKFI